MRQAISRTGQVIAVALTMLLSVACDQGVSFGISNNNKDVFVLVDVSKSYFKHSERSLRRMRGLLNSLKPLDRFTVSRIENCSYSDDAVLISTRALGERSIDARNDVLELAKDLAALSGKLSPTNKTDIRGALLMAGQHFERSLAVHKVLVIFSDMIEDLPPDCVRDSSPINLPRVTVIIADVSISQSDARDPASRKQRLDSWKQLLIDGGAKKVELAQGVFEVQSIIDSESAS